MSSISPIKDWGSRLLFVTPGSSWREVIERLLMDVEEGLGSTKLVEFAEDIARLPVANRLYPSSCMFNLVVSDTPDFQSVNGVLHVAYRSDIERFVIHHIGLDGQQEFITCLLSEATPIFEQFALRKCVLWRSMRSLG